MKITIVFLSIFLLVTVSSALSKPITKGDFDNAYRVALSETMADYPLIYKVTTNFIENGKTVRTVTDISEIESSSHFRMTRTILPDRQEKYKNRYKITYGFGNVFCSEDKVIWRNSDFFCFWPVSLYGPRESESIECSVTEKLVDGKMVKIFLKYSVFPQEKGSEKQEFSELVATIDSRGFFKTVVTTEGTLNPRNVNLVNERSWATTTDIAPVVAPLK